MAKIFVEVADTPIKRATGLMYRKTLPKDHGMLFKFQEKDYQRFWMKNTYIPLDIAFLDDDGTIFQISELIPLSTRMICSSKPCKYALEVPNGWFKQNGVVSGKKVFGEAFTGKKIVVSQNINSGAGQEDLEDKNDVPFIDDEIPDSFDDSAFSNPEGKFDPMSEEPTANAGGESVGQENVMVLRTHRDKIQFARDNNKLMEVSYITLSGKYLPPRRIGPIPNEGYVLKKGKNGEALVAFDLSPSIQGAGWTIKGMQPKSFILNNIIALNVVEEGKGGEKEEIQTLTFMDKLKNYFDRGKNLKKAPKGI